MTSFFRTTFTFVSESSLIAAPFLPPAMAPTIAPTAAPLPTFTASFRVRFGFSLERFGGDVLRLVLADNLRQHEHDGGPAFDSPWLIDAFDSTSDFRSFRQCRLAVDNNRLDDTCRERITGLLVSVPMASIIATGDRRAGRNFQYLLNYQAGSGRLPAS